MVYRIQVIISVYINIGGFCKLELFGKEIVIYTSCTACSYQDNDKDNNPYNSTLLFIHFSLSGFFVCKYRQISVSFLLLTDLVNIAVAAL